MSDFHHAALQELTDQQVRFAPPARRQEQLARAEALRSELEPDRVYPYSFISFRLTDYRSDDHAGLRVTGADLRHDLGLFIDRVERSLPPLPVELAAEPMLTLEEVSRQFNVSTKTVSRWRMQGLVARHVLRGKRRQLGFPLSAVEGFATAHRHQVERGSRFSHLTAAEKDEIVLAARTLAGAGRNLTDVSKSIAGRLGRSTEAVRYTIKNFDRSHPADAVFPARTGPLDATAKGQIYAAFQEGSPMQLIAQRFGRTPSSVYRVVNEVRARRLIETPVDLIPTPDFDDVTAERDREMLGEMPNETEFMEKLHSMRAPKDVEAHMTYLYQRPLLNREQEAHLFRKMNYMKHKLKAFVGDLDPQNVRNADLARIEKAHAEIKRVRDLLIECNQRLVHNLATKHLQPGRTWTS